MAKIHPLYLALGFALSVTSAHGQCYELIWSEEFNYTGLPSDAYWTFETGGGGWGNNELQYYLADSANAYVSEGTLVITARNETFGARDYTSARLITKDKFEFRYGRIEASLKLPYGQGIWPAFWMMGENISQVGWPACGEADIMEMVGGADGDNTIYGTVHWDNGGSHAQSGGSHTLPSGVFADTFHVFVVEWTPQSISWSVDGIQYHAMTITGEEFSEFHNEFFLLLNLAVGGNWPGSPDGSTVFPQAYEVDYIRVYRDLELMEIEGPERVAELSTGRVFSLPASDSLEYLWEVPEDAVVTGGQGSHELTVDWGCLPGEVSCTLTSSCGSVRVGFPVQVDNQVSGPLFVDEGEEELVFMAPEMSGTTYAWEVPGDAVITAGQGTDSLTVDWGSAYGPVTLSTGNACGTSQYTHMVYAPGQYPFPDPGTEHLIPGTILATDFDYGGNGKAYLDHSAANEGDGPRQDEAVDTEYKDGGQPNVGWINDGEWLEYSIRVDSSWAYNLAVRVASDNASGGPFSILANGEVRKEGIMVPGTGGWDRFITRNIGRIPLYETDTVLRIRFDQGGFNMGKMTFSYAASTGLEQAGDGSAGWMLYPNPARGLITLKTGRVDFTYRIIDLAGSEVARGRSGSEETAVDIGHLEAGTYVVLVTLPEGGVMALKFIRLP